MDQFKQNKRKNNNKMSEYRFEFKNIPHGFNDLTDLFSEDAVKLHHLKHEYGYFTKLQSLVGKNVIFKKSSLEEIIRYFNQNKNDEENIDIKNNACGLYNHQIWWKMLTPKNKYKKPNSDIKSIIEKNFNSFEEFEDNFKNLSKNLFGSGWVWLLCKNGKLSLASCQNQNNPISEGLGYPLLGIDVWEHAFYVDYLNRKKDYVNKFLNYVNWDEITNRYFESEKSAL